MAHFCINRSGRTLQVTIANNGGAVVGSIAPNQVFVWTHGFGDGSGDYQGVYFLNQSTVEWKTGWLSGAQHLGGLTPLTRCCLYSLDPGFGRGEEYIFKTRHAVNRFTSDGKYIDTLPANTFITTKDCSAREANKKQMRITSYGPDGGGPTECTCYIDISVVTMMFDSFALIGTLR